MPAEISAAQRPRSRAVRPAQWCLGSAITVYLGIHLVKDQEPTTGTVDIVLYGVMVFALVVLVLTTEAVRTRRPTLRFENGPRGTGLGVRILPPEHNGKRRLRDETLSLSREIHEYLQTQPPSFSEALTGHAALMSAATEEERNALWEEQNSRRWQRMQEEQRQLAQLFGVRVAYLLNEYRHRGMLSESDAGKIEWYMHSNHWAPNAANELGALAHRL